MKKYNFYFIFMVLLAGCMNNRSTRNYRYTFKRENHLYIEVYKSGILGKLTSQYLTDSASFRLYLGSFDDEKARIHCKMDGDRIYVEKRERIQGTGPESDVLRTISGMTYSLRGLKKKHIFE